MTAPTAGWERPAARGPVAAPAPAPDYEALYHGAPCGYLTTDGAGAITGVNDTFLEWTERRRDELLGTPLLKLFPISDQILYSTHCMPQLSMVGAVAEVAVEVFCADRTRRSALLSAVRTSGPSGTEDEAEVRVVLFNAHERLAYERNLVQALRRAERSEERQASVEADLVHLTHHDALTGLPNRAELLERLDVALAGRTPHEGMRLAVVVINLDHFRDVNDSLGLAAGDEVLGTVAERLCTTARTTSTVARITGDEFVVTAEVVDAPAAERLAGRILEALGAPMVVESLEFVVTATAGIALAEPGDTGDRVLRQADIAMYRAKARGRNGWARHEPVEVGPSGGRLRALGDLRQGIARGELRLHYQPRIDLASGTVGGAEALVRWQHPTRGLLPPSEFVDLAESSGLVLALGSWVLDEALAQARRWRDADDATCPEIAVNLSTRQLLDPGLTDMVASALDIHGMVPSQLMLEITETALMADPEAATRALDDLKTMGIGLAVDDFGTGYSSLTYLKQFPIDELKIDRSFVMGLGTDRGDTAIVTSCVQLAHALGIRAVAEGVEKETQHRALLTLGCDQAQGYLYARPLPPDAFEAWCREGGVADLLPAPTTSLMPGPPPGGQAAAAER